MRAIFWKELSDHFGRKRFLLLYGLVAWGLLWGAVIDIDAVVVTGNGFVFLDIFTTNRGVPISLLSFIGFLGPILGIALGFDSINSERTQGTLARLLAQPVYRDAVFNGKFLAGLFTLAVVLFSMGVGVIGLVMFRVGIAPSAEEVVRLLGFFAVGVTFLAFWLALSMTASIFLRTAVASALVSIGLWIAGTFIVLLLATEVAERIVPEIETAEDRAQRFSVEQWISRASPGNLFTEATSILLDPITGRVLNPFDTNVTAQGIDLSTPISAGQSLELVWPHIVALIAMIAILLALSYVKFMREEIRA
ncbi:MAG: ABC transporter permease subunit [Dehalococcoidia bacterium]